MQRNPRLCLPSPRTGDETQALRRSVTLAYLLQYVRKDFFEECVAPAVLPLDFKQRIDEEAERRLYHLVKVFDDRDLARHQHVDLMDFARVQPTRTFRILKTMTAEEFKTLHLLQLFGVDTPAMLQLRRWMRRRNGSVRASKVVAVETEPLMSRKEVAASDFDVDGIIPFLVDISARSKAPFFDVQSETECHVFFKVRQNRTGMFLCILLGRVQCVVCTMFFSFCVRCSELVYSPYPLLVFGFSLSSLIFVYITIISTTIMRQSSCISWPGCRSRSPVR